MMLSRKHWMAAFAVVMVIATARAQDCVMVCKECLETEGCGAWTPVTGCLARCNEIADASCYTVETFPDLNVQETCQKAADDRRG